MNLSIFVTLILCSFFNQIVKRSDCNIIPRQSAIDLKDPWSHSVAKNIFHEKELRIIGGDHVKIEEYPWIVSLFYIDDYGHYRFTCGGSIISLTKVVTAAHCTYQTNADMNKRNYKIRAGSSDVTEGGQVVSILKIVYHPKFHPSTQPSQNDIAILFLATSLEISSKVGIIGLPKGDEVITEGTSLQVAGWGSTEESGMVSKQLMAVSVPVVEIHRCSKFYEDDEYLITESMVCAGLEEGGKDSCTGDSGGPLTLDGRTLIGIVQWGRGCARPRRPGVYARVASSIEWIRNHL